MGKLSAEEAKIYDLVARQVIAAHYNNAVFSYTTIHSLVDNRAEFISKGKVLLEEGWRKVIHHSKDSADKDELLPLLQENEQGTVVKANVKKVKPNRQTAIRKVI